MNNSKMASINHYVVPDTGLMRRAKDQLNSNASAETFGFLPATRDKLLSASHDLSDAHQQLFDHVKKVTASLANTGLRTTLASMHDISQNAAMVVSQKNDNLSSLLARAVKRVGESQIALVAASQHLKKLAGEFEAITFGGQSTTCDESTQMR